MGYFKNQLIEKLETERLATHVQCGPDCQECGGLGYTIEKSEDGEIQVGCQEGWERAMDIEADRIASDMEAMEMSALAHADFNFYAEVQ